MNLDELNESVTNAILRAESEAVGSWEARRAFRDVSELEEEIANLMGARTAEGEIARLGAIAAALSAGEPLRAVQLAERFSVDGLSAAARVKLEELLREAEDELHRGLDDEPSVQPIRFSLRAA